VSLRDDAPPDAAALPDVRTARLDLRRFATDDLDELATVCAQREVWKFPYGRGLTRDETEGFLSRQIAHWDTLGFGCWIARLADGSEGAHDGEMVGYVGLSVPTFLPEVLPAVEVGWRFVPAAWGRGLATEGATAALDHAFATLGLDTVCSLPQVDNGASVRVADRLGMTRVREVAIPANEQRGGVTGVLYEMRAGDWPPR
jgi:RimJ/RimL family protein N-acetyltransferase